jgi:molecular chaperone DnaK
MGAVIGIDLGTTNTVAAAVRGGKAVALADADGATLIPSVVAFHPNGSVLVGAPARERRIIDARSTIYSVKRLIGRSWDSEEVRRARVRFPFEMRPGPGQAPLIVARGESYTLSEISAFVLRKARSVAEAALGEPVTQAVITVPANFNDLQRAATKVAGRVAGLDVLRIVNEPTAAALAYGHGRGGAQRIAVYDFGGGTFDVTLLDVSRNVFEVLATAGDTFLGGDDIDLLIAERMADAFLAQHRYDPRADFQSFERIRVAAEHLKTQLSTAELATQHIAELAHGRGGKALDLDFAMARSELDELALPVVERTLRVCERALSTARLDVASFDAVLLVGGSTRMPLVKAKVFEYFGREPQTGVNPDEVVALGAAVQAAALGEGRSRPSEIPAAPSPGKRSSAYPPTAPAPPRAGRSQPPPPPRREPAAGTKLGEDELPLVHAVSAALPSLEAALPVPEPLAQRPPRATRELPLLVDVTPLSLVVETIGGYCDVVIARNTQVPCERVRDFATAADGQTRVRVRVGQGEDGRFSENTLLGEVELDGLPAARRGEITVLVRFALDTNGMLSVTAEDAATGRAARATLRLAGLSEMDDLSELMARQARLAQG